MKRFPAFVVLTLVAGVLLLAAPEALEVKGKVLIVDETEELVTSIRLEAMARILIEHGFSVKAILGFPEETVEAGPFDLVFVIPRESEYIWLCVPPEAEANGVNETELVGLKELVVKVFGGERELRTPADDLWPLLLSLRLAALGIFGDV